MADATSPPSARPRKILTDIAAATWEHPADRAALQSLRAIPGFDMAVKKIIGFLGERGIRLMFQANAVRVGPNQFPTLHSLNSNRQSGKAFCWNRGRGGPVGGLGPSAGNRRPRLMVVTR